MKSLRDYLNESEYTYNNPVVGDNFAIDIKEECLLETYICDEIHDGIVLHADDRLMGLLESYGYLGEENCTECGYTFESCSCDHEVDEAEYHGRDVPLNKPMQGDVKKSKVYVKNPKGNVVKVNFGDPNMTIKKSNPARRRSFRARHNCENPGPKTSARYWSCRAW